MEIRLAHVTTLYQIKYIRMRCRHDRSILCVTNREDGYRLVVSTFNILVYGLKSEKMTISF